MKAIILAAGRGERMRPYTDQQPKCMVEYEGQPIIDHILQVLDYWNIDDKVVISGYRDDVLRHYLQNKNIKFYLNNAYDNTNMVFSLFCAEQEMNDDIIVSYGDIIYSKYVLKKLLQCDAAFAVAVDIEWERLWKIRMENPLDDAETMKIDALGNIIELGKKTKTYHDIQGQYMGLFKISKEALTKIKPFYHTLDRNRMYDGKDFNNMYMTSFIQLVVDRLMPVRSVKIAGQWLEFDTATDLLRYQTARLKMD